MKTHIKPCSQQLPRRELRKGATCPNDNFRGQIYIWAYGSEKHNSDPYCNMVLFDLTHAAREEECNSRGYPISKQVHKYSYGSSIKKCPWK